MSNLIHPKGRNYKNIFESLDILKQIQKDHFCILNKPGTPLDKLIAQLNKKEDKGFTLSFEDSSHTNFNMEDITDVVIETKDHKLRVDRVLVNCISPPSVAGGVFNFWSEDFNKKNPAFFRLIIPLPKKIDFHFYIEHFRYETKKNRSSECLRINYTGVTLDLYFFHDHDARSFLIIDSASNLPFETFSEYCFSTLLSYGYITGKFQQSEGYFFTYENKDLKNPVSFFYTEFRDSLFSLYTPIYSNPYGIIRDKKIATKTYKTVRNVSLREFSSLCQWVYDSKEFASIIILIIESSTSSLLVMPSGFSVALEGLTDMIVKRNEDKVAPIKDKNLAKKIRNELNQVIKNNSESLTPEGLAILKARIDQINQLTNKAKLRKPFEILNIKLSPEDDSAIEHRNDFLHGRITLSPDDTKILSGDDIKVADRKIYYVTVRLYTLLSALILKSIGYDNKILNYPKIHENVHKKKLEEPFYRSL